MKKIGKNSKKGFTLVELIVVLVILAIMAAMLVPALTGYIKKAREEKDYQAASSALVAAQAIVTEYYGVHADAELDDAMAEVDAGAVNALIGDGIVDDASVTALNSDFSIKKATFTINGNDYSYDSGVWTADGANA